MHLWYLDDLFLVEFQVFATRVCDHAERDISTVVKLVWIPRSCKSTIADCDKLARATKQSEYTICFHVTTMYRIAHCSIGMRCI
jgi:hypothetical protein